MMTISQGLFVEKVSIFVNDPTAVVKRLVYFLWTEFNVHYYDDGRGVKGVSIRHGRAR